MPISNRLRDVLLSRSIALLKSFSESSDLSFWSKDVINLFLEILPIIAAIKYANKDNTSTISIQISDGSQLLEFYINIFSEMFGEKYSK